MKTAMQQAIKEIAELWSSPSDVPNYSKIFEVLESKLEIENQQRDEFAIWFGKYLDSLKIEDMGTLSIKQLLEIYKKEQGL